MAGLRNSIVGFGFNRWRFFHNFFSVFLSSLCFWRHSSKTAPHNQPFGMRLFCHLLRLLLLQLLPPSAFVLAAASRQRQLHHRFNHRAAQARASVTVSAGPPGRVQWPGSEGQVGGWRPCGWHVTV